MSTPPRQELGADSKSWNGQAPVIHIAEPHSVWGGQLLPGFFELQPQLCGPAG